MASRANPRPHRIRITGATMKTNENARPEANRETGIDDAFDSNHFNATRNFRIVPRRDAGNHEFIAGEASVKVLRGETPRYALAILVKPVDLSRQPCTCFARGQCIVCRYWADTDYSRNARRALT